VKLENTAQFLITDVRRVVGDLANFHVAGAMVVTSSYEGSSAYRPCTRPPYRHALHLAERRFHAPETPGAKRRLFRQPIWLGSGRQQYKRATESKRCEKYRTVAVSFMTRNC